MTTITQKMGTFCIIAGVLIILTRVFMWVFFDRFMPVEWGGRTLILTGAGLLGTCGIGSYLKGKNDSQ